MNKRVVIISSTHRAGGNSDVLCDEFMRGCLEAGCEVEKISLRGRNIGFCHACYACRKTGECVQRDDAIAVMEAMCAADVIVLATPVYFYSLSGQLKTLIDRCLSCGARLADKEFYFIATAAADRAAMERTMDALRGFTDCLPGARVNGEIYGEGAWQLGEIQGSPAMREAYEAGRRLG